MKKGNNSFARRNLATRSIENTSGIRSVNRAIDILICMSNGVNTLTDISNLTGLTKPTTYRLLQTLEDRFMVAQDPVTQKYHLGPTVTRLASDPRTNHFYLICCAAATMRKLWDATGENIELNMMVGCQYNRLYEFMGKHKLKVIEGEDPVGPVFVGSAAKVLLGQLNDRDLKLFINNIRLEQVTEKSVVDKRKLLVQVNEARKRGYCISYGERIPGAMCISAPIYHYFWPVALSLAAPESRLSVVADEVARQVTSGARIISKNLEKFYEAKEVVTREGKNPDVPGERI
jgi:DNA-binding IclR family transcriptional regulator